MSKYITENVAKDGIDRRGLLHCMAWAGTGVLWEWLAASLLGTPLEARKAI